MQNPIEISCLGTHLRKLREENKLSQQQLADIANISKSTIKRIENAKTTVSFDIIVSIAKALDISICKVVGFKIEKKSE